MNENELTIVVKESGLEVSQSASLLEKFNTFFEQAKEWEVIAKNLVVSDEGDKDGMAKAREARLVLKKIRTDAETTRKSMKEQYVRTGKAIDGVANVIKALVEPLEEHLERQEKFSELMQEERERQKKESRTQELLKYTDDFSIYNFENMSEEVFLALSESLKKDHLEKKEKERIAEEQRIEAERIEKENNEKMKIENEKLKKDKEERDAKEAEELKNRKEEERRKEEIYKKQLEAERIEKENLQKEIDAKKREEAAKELADNKMKEEQEEKERQAKMAPEKEKLFAYSELIRAIVTPEGLSKAGLEVVKKAEIKLLEISQDIKLAIKEL